ncbi:MAG: glycosyltransferase family 87 protein [Amphiplicatus sp.]
MDAVNIRKPGPETLDLISAPWLTALGLALAAVFLWNSPSEFIFGGGETGVTAGRDGLNVWAAGKAALQGKAATLYDVDAYIRLLKDWRSQDIGWHAWSYPPFLLLFLWPLGFFDYYPAFWIWMAGSFAVMAFALYAAFPNAKAAAAGVILCALCSPAGLVNIWTGQNGFLVCGLFLSGLLLIDRRPLLAGALFAILAFKPQMGLILPLALIAGGYWRVIAATVVTGVALVLLSAAVFGVDVWVEYVTQTLGYHVSVMERKEGLGPLMYPSAFKAAILLGWPPIIGYLLNAATALFAAYGVIQVWRRSGVPREFRIAVLLLGSTLATPYLHNYDLTIAAAAILLLAPGVKTVVERCVVIGVWMLPIIVMFTNASGVPTGPLFLTALFVVSLKIVRRSFPDEAAQGGEAFIAKACSLADRPRFTPR